MYKKVRYWNFKVKILTSRLKLVVLSLKTIIFPAKYRLQGSSNMQVHSEEILNPPFKKLKLENQGLIKVDIPNHLKEEVLQVKDTLSILSLF